jgi:hypothetical protein
LATLFGMPNIEGQFRKHVATVGTELTSDAGDECTSAFSRHIGDVDGNDFMFGMPNIAEVESPDEATILGNGIYDLT